MGFSSSVRREKDNPKSSTRNEILCGSEVENESRILRIPRIPRSSSDPQTHLPQTRFFIHSFFQANLLRSGAKLELELELGFRALVFLEYDKASLQQTNYNLL